MLRCHLDLDVVAALDVDLATFDRRESRTGFVGPVRAN
jgi:hypothetical protein